LQYPKLRILVPTSGLALPASKKGKEPIAASTMPVVVDDEEDEEEDIPPLVRCPIQRPIKALGMGTSGTKRVAEEVAAPLMCKKRSKKTAGRMWRPSAAIVSLDLKATESDREIVPDAPAITPDIEEGSMGRNQGGDEAPMATEDAAPEVLPPLAQDPPVGDEGVTVARLGEAPKTFNPSLDFAPVSMGMPDDCSEEQFQEVIERLAPIVDEYMKSLADDD
jgi:hypothetical protein